MITAGRKGRHLNSWQTGISGFIYEAKDAFGNFVISPTTGGIQINFLKTNSKGVIALVEDVEYQAKKNYHHGEVTMTWNDNGLCYIAGVYVKTIAALDFIAKIGDYYFAITANAVTIAIKYIVFDLSWNIVKQGDLADGGLVFGNIRVSLNKSNTEFTYQTPKAKAAPFTVAGTYSTNLNVWEVFYKYSIQVIADVGDPEYPIKITQVEALEQYILPVFETTQVSTDDGSGNITSNGTVTLLSSGAGILQRYYNENVLESVTSAGLSVSYAASYTKTSVLSGGGLILTQTETASGNYSITYSRSDGGNFSETCNATLDSLSVTDEDYILSVSKLTTTNQTLKFIDDNDKSSITTGDYVGTIDFSGTLPAPRTMSINQNLTHSHNKLEPYFTFQNESVIASADDPFYVAISPYTSGISHDLLVINTWGFTQENSTSEPAGTIRTLYIGLPKSVYWGGGGFVTIDSTNSIADKYKNRIHTNGAADKVVIINNKGIEKTILNFDVLAYRDIEGVL